MAPRVAISNFIMTVVTLFFMFIIALLLKGRMRLPSEQKADEVARAPAAEQVPKAVPVGQRIAEPRAYKTGEFWVLSHPELVATRADEAGTVRVKSGPKEDVFVLYGIGAVPATATRPKRIAEQAAYFRGATPSRLMETGAQAHAWTSQLLAKHPFIVYTKYSRIAGTERYYAFVRIEVEGKQHDLGELLVKKGYATPTGQAPDGMPDAGRTPEDYRRDLHKVLAQAKAEEAGLWAAK
jgi:endonuclease YncB( thermonuclease family)